MTNINIIEIKLQDEINKLISTQSCAIVAPQPPTQASSKQKNKYRNHENRSPN